ncbi:62ac32a5-ada2-4c51-a614-c4c9a375f712 [Sclerotinia trifoliorum]|uniref:62ac32a5-ada2-4c51-a614-c4c9a375f712 n=1 Tax=Sclerotinia trifoliorum TaxID=28548 RepID=A0A8H2W1S9_9HELO|nr:62ac32a5-ada2-4c51-a614-c4c9a375f712 [Sclerotinia trifoliorum]
MRQSVFVLAALSLWQGCTAQGTKETLIPYHPADLGLVRRDAPPTITLQDEVSLIWGSSNGSTFVNVTLNTGETELVISTEHFASSLTDVQCTGDLALTFKDNATFQDAIADWSWVNFHENRTFFLINNWGSCAAASESGRQPWIVHGVDVYDEQNFIVNFNATLADWDDVMSDAVIEFGSMPSTSTKRDDTISKSLSLSLAHDLPQTFFSKTTNNGLDFSITCPGCATTGSINVQGKIVMNTNFIGIPTSVKSVSINATPQGVGANLALGFTVSGTLGSGWSKDWNLITVGLPGWSIPKIIDLGPQFSVDAGFTLSGIEGNADISAGINVAIPDSSSAVLGISGIDSSFNGWIPTITPQTPKVDVEVDGNLELFTSIGLDVGLTVLGKYGFGGGLFLTIPDVKIDLGAEFNTQGVCSGSADVFGVKLGATVGVDLGLGVYTESGGDKTWKANTTIYSNSNLITPIDKCFPLGPTLPATIKGVSIKTVGTVPVSSSTKAASTTQAATTSAKPTSSASSSNASTTAVSSTGRTSGSASGTTIKASGTGVSSSIKVSGTGVASSKIVGTGVSSSIHGYATSHASSSSSKLSGTGISSSIYGYATAPALSSTGKLSGTGISSSIHGYATAPAFSSTGKLSGTGISSSIHGYATAPALSSTGKLSGTGISSSIHGYATAPAFSSTGKLSGTGISSSIHGYATAPALSSTGKLSGTGISSSIHGYATAPAFSSTGKLSGTGVTSSVYEYGSAPVYSSTTKISGTGVSSSSKVIGTGVSSVSYGTHPDTTLSYVKGASTSTHVTEGYGGFTTSLAKSPSIVVSSSSLYISASGVSSVKTAVASSGTSSVLGNETSKSSSSSTKATTTVGGPVYGYPTSSALGLETSKASSSTAASTTKVSSTVVASSTSTKASSTVIPTKSATGTIAPAPIATGTIPTCDKWVIIEDTGCSCQNIENFYGVSSANLLTWNPALGSECKLTIGEAVCIGVKGYYKRAVNGRLARFVHA